MIILLVELYAIIIGIVVACLLISITYEGAICPFGLESDGGIHNTFECLSDEFESMCDNYAYAPYVSGYGYNSYTLPDTNVFTYDTFTNTEFQKAWKYFLTDSTDRFYIISKTSPIQIKFKQCEDTPSGTTSTMLIWKRLIGAILKRYNATCKGYF